MNGTAPSRNILPVVFIVGHGRFAMERVCAGRTATFLSAEMGLSQSSAGSIATAPNIFKLCKIRK